jgi:SAM-dependent methyltransferase
MDASGWDERYREQDLVWGIQPNRWVEQELATEPPGAALDLACGEGRNALWLAGLGWEVTAVDFSPVAIEKARTLAAGAQGPVTWVVADALTYRAPEPVDLALLCYLQLPADERRTAVRAAAASLSPGGTLLVIAHDSANLSEGTGGPQDATVLYTAEDLRGDLAGTDLVVTRAEAVHRPVAGAARPAIDVLFRASRARRNLPH